MVWHRRPTTPRERSPSPRDGDRRERQPRLTDGGTPGPRDGEPTDGPARGGPDAARHAAAVAAALADYGRVVEVGIGERTDVAARLHGRGVEVVAVDRRRVETPDGVRFVREDVTDPDPTVYRGAGALYALNLPPDLHAPVADLAREVAADLAFTTLGGDPATVPTRPETLPGGTLHWAREPGDGHERR